MLWDFVGSPYAFKKKRLYDQQKCIQTLFDSQDSLKTLSLNFVVGIIPADGLRPLGGKASAGTVVTKFRSYVISMG